MLWAQQQTEQYGPLAQKGWRLGFGLWRLVRAVLNPLQAAGQETSSMIVEKTASVLSYRLRTYATRLLVLEVGRAAIDLYSRRLALSDEEIRAAQERDLSDVEALTAVPVRVLLVGQVSAGKSSLVNAMAAAVRAAVGPLPTTAHVSEHRLELEGKPAVILVDMPGLNEYLTKPEELLREAACAGSSRKNLQRFPVRAPPLPEGRLAIRCGAGRLRAVGQLVPEESLFPALGRLAPDDGWPPGDGCTQPR